jgi:hypothetical protein
MVYILWETGNIAIVFGKSIWLDGLAFRKVYYKSGYKRDHDF